MRRYRVPADIAGRYASRVDGVWSSHRTPGGAWRRAWGGGNVLVLELTGDGYGTPLPEPEERPRGAGGEHRSPRRKLSATDAQFESWDAAAERAGQTWAEWARNTLDRAADVDSRK